MIMFMNLNIYSSQARYSSDSDLQLQQNAKTLGEILNHDLRKIGFNYTGSSIITAQEKLFSFYSDIDSNGVVDVVTYSLSDSSMVTQTTNPKDKILIRMVNADTSLGPSLGITDLKFSYLNSKSKKTAAVDSIKYIRAEIWVETPEPIEGKYPFTYWEMTINPRNL